MKLLNFLFFFVCLILGYSGIGQVQPLQISHNVHDHVFLSDLKEADLKAISVNKTEIRQKNKRKTVSTKHKAYTIEVDWSRKKAKVVFYGKGNLSFADEPSADSDFYFLKSLNNIHLQGNSSSIIRWNDKDQIIQAKIYSDTNFRKINSEVNYFYSEEKLVGYTKRPGFSSKYDQYQLEYSSNKIVLSKSKERNESLEMTEIKAAEKNVLEEWTLDSDGNMIQHIQFSNDKIKSKTAIEYLEGIQKSLIEMVYHPRTNEPLISNTIVYSKFDSLSVRTSINYPYSMYLLKQEYNIGFAIPIVQNNTMLNGQLTKAEISWGNQITNWEFIKGTATYGEEFVSPAGTVKQVVKSEKRTFKNGRVATISGWISVYELRYQYDYEYVKN